jgi:hypothetical protein
MQGATGADKPTVVTSTKTTGTETTTTLTTTVNRQHPSWASTLVIAYGIHKLLLPLRIGVTAAVTPTVVRRLRSMGWNIGRPVQS